VDCPIKLRSFSVWISGRKQGTRSMLLPAAGATPERLHRLADRFFAAMTGRCSLAATGALAPGSKRHGQAAGHVRRHHPAVEENLTGPRADVPHVSQGANSA